MTDENETTTTNVRRSKFEPQQYVTFDTNVMTNRVKIFNAHRNAVSLKNVEDEALNVVDVMAEIGTRARTDTPCQNTYLFCDDGRIFFTQSNGIGDTVNEIVEMLNGDFAANTTNGYVTVRQTATALSEGRTYKQLELLAV